MPYLQTIQRTLSYLVLASISFLMTACDVDSSKNSVQVLSTLPEFYLTDSSNIPIQKKDLDEHVWVASFMTTRCKTDCLALTKKITELQEFTKGKSFNINNINWVSISVDPEYDTSEVLAQHTKSNNINSDRRKFLTGTSEAILALITEGFKLSISDDSKNKPITHLPTLVLVDWLGRIRGYYNVFDESEMQKLKDDLVLVATERVAFPPSIVNPPWVEERKTEQIVAANQSRVFHAFNFTDKVEESNINFRNMIVDDASITYKAVHYDHGTGIVIADVDGDSHYDIFFITAAGTNQLWRNLGNGKFEDITKVAGLESYDRIGVSASFADIDNDGDPDLYTTSVRFGNQLFENDGAGIFRNITEASGLAYKGHSSGATFFDFNRDGLLDLLLTNVGIYTQDKLTPVTTYKKGEQVKTSYEYYVGFSDAFKGHLKGREEPSILYKNLGGNRFENVSEAMQLIDNGWSGDASVIDGNNDNWPDLYILNMQGHDHYYENIEGERFVDKTDSFFPKTPWGSMGIKSMDFDNDGQMDIFVTDMHSDMSQVIDHRHEKNKSEMKFGEDMLKSGGKSIYGNAFYKKNGDRYTEISDEIGAENFWPWGLSSGDLNADGFEDVFISASMNYPFRYGVNSLLLNDHGKNFMDSEYLLGVEPRLNNQTALPWFSISCPEHDNAKARPCKKLKGQKVIMSAMGTRSSVIFDLDNDGDLDIVTNEFNAIPMVLISNLSEKQKSLNYLKVDLVGTKSNKGGIGAKVSVHTGEKVFTKVNDGKSGYLSQSIYPLYFGLGASQTVDKIVVQWPSGITQLMLSPIIINSKISITEVLH